LEAFFAAENYKVGEMQIEYYRNIKISLEEIYTKDMNSCIMYLTLWFLPLDDPRRGSYGEIG
jgi:hypothetical protein